MSAPVLTPLPAAAAPDVRTRAQLEALLENIAELQREREAAWQAQEAELAEVRARHRAQLTELQQLLALETSWAEAWARQHRAELGADGALSTAHATLGFRAQAPRIERASRRWTWSRITATLAALPWGARYLRTPEPVVDPEAIVADLDKLSREELHAAGMEVVEGEQFFLTTRGVAETAKQPESAWREAA
jgi:phage host-nuclease inhibitor protein Gam